MDKLLQMIRVATQSKPNASPCSSEELTEAERRLLEICQEIQFGRLIDLHVEQGQPLLGSCLTVERDHKYGSCEQVTRPSGDHYMLKAQQRDFIERLRATEDLQIMRVQIQHGLPFRGTTIETI